eukprot:3616747-Prymnesium_polylepis.1
MEGRAGKGPPNSRTVNDTQRRHRRASLHPPGVRGVGRVSPVPRPAAPPPGPASRAESCYIQHAVGVDRGAAA